MNEELAKIHACYSITFTRQSKHSPERLWRAITDSAEVSRWMAHPARVEPRVGGAYAVDFSRTGGLNIDGVIVAIGPPRRSSEPRVTGDAGEPQHLLRYAWGTGVVEWAIKADGTGSKYALTLAGLEPGSVPAEAFAAGWHCQLADLERYLETGAPSPDEDARAFWNTLRPEYAPRAAIVLEAVR